MRRLIMLVAALFMFGTAAQARQVVQNPRWLAPPDPDVASGLMPAFANAIGVSGRVSLSCWVEREGPPEDCEVVSASPEGLGFEQAALEVARYGVVKPKLVDGTPERARIRFAVPFQVEPLPLRPEAPKAYVGPAPSAEAIDLGRQLVQAHVADMREDAENRIFEGLAEDRRPTVRRWMEELMPLDEKAIVDNLGLILARLVPEAQLRRALENGEPFSRAAPTGEEWAAAATDLLDPKDEESLRELRARYCAAYECEIRP